MNQFQNPNFEDQNNPQVPSGEPMTPGVQQPTSMEEGNAEVLRVWDIQNQQATEGSVGSEGEETTPQPQVPPISQQPQTPETREAEDPIEYVRNNTPGNPETATPSKPSISQEPEGEFAQGGPPQPPVANSEEVTSQPPVTNPKVEEEKDPEDLKQEINSIKQELDSLREKLHSFETLLPDLLVGRKIKDYTDYPDQEPKILSGSGREMILPLGIVTVKFGKREFKKALEDAIPVDEDTYILRYMSERQREDGSQAEPRLLKFTKEQIDKCYSKIQQNEQQTQVSGQQYRQPPTAPEQF